MARRLNWKDNEAWASRSVGGRYQIMRCESMPTGNFWFDVRRLVRTGPSAWNNPGVPGPTPHTLDEAKALAETDNQKRHDGGRGGI